MRNKVLSAVAVALLLFVTLFNSKASAAFVQNANSGAAYQGGGGTSFSITFAATITSGSSVPGTVSWDDTATLTSVVDDKGNNYAALDSIHDAPNGQFAASFFLGNITNGPKTLTFNFSSAISFAWASADEESGSNNTVDVHSGQLQAVPSSGTNNVSSGSATTTVNGDTIWGGSNCTGGGLFGGGSGVAAGTGFTSRSNVYVGASNNGFGTEDATQTTAGSIAATFSGNLGAASSFVTFIIALKSSGGGGGSSTRKTLTGAGK